MWKHTFEYKTNLSSFLIYQTFPFSFIMIFPCFYFIVIFSPFY